MDFGIIEKRARGRAYAAVELERADLVMLLHGQGGQQELTAIKNEEVRP